MPNHWHMVLWPEHDGDLPAFGQHFTNLHVKRWKRVHDEVGEGHLHQGRYKSYPIQNDAYFQAVIRYVERNPLCANLVPWAEDRAWSSLRQASSSAPIPPAMWPVPQPAQMHGAQWSDWVNGPQTEAELRSLRTCAMRGRPFGDDAWVQHTATKRDLGATPRRRGRPCVARRVAWVG